MVLNRSNNSVISADAKGIIEYWDTTTGQPLSAPDTRVKFQYKSDTDLYALAKSRTSPSCIAISPIGDKFVVTSVDKQIRVFDYGTGKLKLQIDESAQSYMVC
jgi:peptidylprolyl isomerase domain and WD repeat-containing protein 1